MEASGLKRSLAICAVFSLIAACASAPKHSNSTPSANPAPAQSPQAEVFGPPEPQPAAQVPQAPIQGPEPLKIRPVVLVLGPGLARGFAYAGAIRAMVEAKIPIGAVVGTEMGSFVGGIYVFDGNINHFDWSLLKFKNDFFIKPDGILSRIGGEGKNAKKFDNELQRLFGEKTIEQATVPFEVALQPQDATEPVIVHKGEAAKAIRAAIADSRVFPPGEWDGRPAISAGSSRPFPVKEARALQIGPVLVIDVLDAPGSPGPDELKDADLVLKPDMSGVGVLDFAKRTDCAFRGRKVIEENLAAIRSLAGIPEAPK